MCYQTLTDIVVGRPVWREDGSVCCYLSWLCQVITIQKIKRLITCTICHIYSMYKVCRQSRHCIADYAVSVPFYFNDTLVTWTVISLTAAKFKPRVLPVHGFDLSYVANSCISVILDDYCLLPAQLCNKNTEVRNVESHVLFTGRCGKGKIFPVL